MSTWFNLLRKLFVSKIYGFGRKFKSITNIDWLGYKFTGNITHINRLQNHNLWLAFLLNWTFIKLIISFQSELTASFMFLGTVNLLQQQRAKRFYRTNLRKSFSSLSLYHSITVSRRREVSIIKLSTILLCGCVLTFARCPESWFCDSTEETRKVRSRHEIKLNVVQSVCRSLRLRMCYTGWAKRAAEKQFHSIKLQVSYGF